MKKLLILSSLLLLSACQADQGDLQEWMNNTQKEAKRKLKPASIPMAAPVEIYAPEIQPDLDAFNPKRLNSAMQGANAPNPNRPKEVLENFSLDTLRYVGSFRQGGRISAFIDAEGRVYTVGIGNYMGQNHGRIKSIQEDKIILSELVEDTNGNWQAEPTELKLSTANANKK